MIWRPAALRRPGFWLASVAGGLQALSIAWPGTGQAHGWLQVLSLMLLASGLVRMAGAGTRDPSPPTLRAAVQAAAWHGAAFAVAWLAGVFWWLHVSMHQVGGLPAPLSVAAVLLLAAALGLYYVGAATSWVALVRLARWEQRPLAASVLFAALWLLAELARGTLWTGFPWGAGGYAHVDGWLAALAPWVGVYGISAIAAFAAMRLALPGGRVRAWMVLAALLAGAHALPDNDALTRTAGTAEVELLQANISQTDKFEAVRGIREALAWYAERLLASRQNLVVAPETAIPVLPRQLPAAYWQALQTHFASTSRPCRPWRPGPAPAGTPKAVIDKVYAEVQRITALPDVRERLTTLGAEPSAMSPTEFGHWLKAEIPAMAKIVKDEKITAE